MDSYLLDHHGSPKVLLLKNIYVNEILISRSKKEMKDFIRVTFEDYNLGKASQNAEELFCPLEVKELSYKFLRERVIHHNI